MLLAPLHFARQICGPTEEITSVSIWDCQGAQNKSAMHKIKLGNQRAIYMRQGRVQHAHVDFSTQKTSFFFFKGEMTFKGILCLSLKSPNLISTSPFKSEKATFIPEFGEYRQHHSG